MTAAAGSATVAVVARRWWRRWRWRRRAGRRRRRRRRQQSARSGPWLHGVAWRHARSALGAPVSGGRPRGQLSSTKSCRATILASCFWFWTVGWARKAILQEIPGAEFGELRKYPAQKHELKGVYGGIISNLAPLLNYLRRRSPAPPFPPDSRQAGERGAKRMGVVSAARPHSAKNESPRNRSGKFL